MSISTPTMTTIGAIARRLGQPLHRVQYVVRTRQIRPCGRAGNVRVFPEETIEAVDAELQRIDERQHDHQQEEKV